MSSDLVLFARWPTYVIGLPVADHDYQEINRRSTVDLLASLLAPAIFR